MNRTYLINVYSKSTFSLDSILSERLEGVTEEFKNGYHRALEKTYPDNLVVVEEIGIKPFALPEPFLTEWKEALRSGNYKQGEERLLVTKRWLAETNGSVYDVQENDVKSYCCLGVACKMKGVDDNELLGHELPSDIFSYKGDAPIPDELLANSALTDGIVSVLTHLNDSISRKYIDKMIQKFPSIVFHKMPEKDTQIKYSFEDIADWLDQNVQGYEPEKEK